MKPFTVNVMVKCIALALFIFAPFITNSLLCFFAILTAAILGCWSDIRFFWGERLKRERELDYFKALNEQRRISEAAE